MATVNIEVKKTLDALGKHHIVESNRSSNSWYRKWSDGFIEQGGYQYVGSNNVMTTNITYPIAFTNADSYAVVTTLRTSSQDVASRILTSAHGKTATGVSFSTNTAAQAYVEWYAAGH